jgi:hypothetical protein
MDKAIDYIQGKIDSISQDIACKLHEMKDMPENEKSYNMALLQPFIDLHAELVALIKFCASAKTSNDASAFPIPDVSNQERSCETCIWCASAKMCKTCDEDWSNFERSCC